MENLYVDLENYNEIILLDKLKEENKELKIKVEEYTSTIDRLQKELQTLTEEHTKLQANFSSLLRTARAEIERKSALITQLNVEKDQLVISALQSSTNKQNIRRNAYGQYTPRPNPMKPGPQTLQTENRDPAEHKTNSSKPTPASSHIQQPQIRKDNRSSSVETKPVIKLNQKDDSNTIDQRPNNIDNEKKKEYNEFKRENQSIQQELEDERTSKDTVESYKDKTRDMETTSKEKTRDRERESREKYKDKEHGSKEREKDKEQQRGDLDSDCMSSEVEKLRSRWRDNAKDVREPKFSTDSESEGNGTGGPRGELADMRTRLLRRDQAWRAGDGGDRKNNRSSSAEKQTVIKPNQKYNSNNIDSDQRPNNINNDKDKEYNEFERENQSIQQELEDERTSKDKIESNKDKTRDKETTSKKNTRDRERRSREKHKDKEHRSKEREKDKERQRRELESERLSSEAEKLRCRWRDNIKDVSEAKFSTDSESEGNGSGGARGEVADMRTRLLRRGQGRPRARRVGSGGHRNRRVDKLSPERYHRYREYEDRLGRRESPEQHRRWNSPSDVYRRRPESPLGFDSHRHRQKQTSPESDRHREKSPPIVSYRRRAESPNADMYRRRDSPTIELYRRRESPPTDSYKRNKSRDRRHYRDRERQRSQERVSRRRAGDVISPERKRQRTKSIKEIEEEEERKREEIVEAAIEDTTLYRMLTSCQSPDYTQIDNMFNAPPLKEIKSTPVAILDDPRAVSDKYVIDKSKETISTIRGRNVELKLLKYEDKEVKKPDPIKKIPVYSEEIDQEIYKDIEKLANVSFESDEINETDDSHHTKESRTVPEIDKEIDGTKKIDRECTTTKSNKPENIYKLSNNKKIKAYKIPKKLKSGTCEDLEMKQIAENKNTDQDTSKTKTNINITVDFPFKRQNAENIANGKQDSVKSISASDMYNDLDLSDVTNDNFDVSQTEKDPSSEPYSEIEKDTKKQNTIVEKRANLEKQDFKQNSDSKCDKKTDIKLKFNDLFGDSCSLITPEDLGLCPVQISNKITKECPILEDAVDLNVEEMMEVTNRSKSFAQTENKNRNVEPKHPEIREDQKDEKVNIRKRKRSRSKSTEVLSLTATNDQHESMQVTVLKETAESRTGLPNLDECVISQPLHTPLEHKGPSKKLKIKNPTKIDLVHDTEDLAKHKDAKPRKYAVLTSIPIDPVLKERLQNGEISQFPKQADRDHAEQQTLTEYSNEIKNHSHNTAVTKSIELGNNPKLQEITENSDDIKNPSQDTATGLGSSAKPRESEEVESSTKPKDINLIPVVNKEVSNAKEDDLVVVISSGIQSNVHQIQTNTPTPEVIKTNQLSALQALATSTPFKAASNLSSTDTASEDTNDTKNDVTAETSSQSTVPDLKIKISRKRKRVVKANN